MTEPRKPKVTGWMYLADLGTAEPDMTSEAGTFASAWPAPWLRFATIYVNGIANGITFVDSPARLVVPPGADLSAWPARYRPGFSVDRYMIGWESAEMDVRVICPRVFPEPRRVLGVAEFRLERSEGGWVFRMYQARPLATIGAAA